MKKNFLIIEREFSIRVRKKSFIITTVLVPLLLAACMAVMFVIMLQKDTGKKTVVVIDHSGLAAPALTNTDDLTFEFFPNSTLDSLKLNFEEKKWHAIVDISAVNDSKNVAINMYAFKQPNFDVQQYVGSHIEKAVEQFKLKEYNITGLDTIMAAVKTNLHVKTFLWGTDGKEKATSTELYMVLAYVFSFMIYMFIAIFGSIVMRGVIEEKTSRIVEVIVSSVKPFQLMVGKIIGVASVGLLQFLIWIILTGIAFIVLQGYIDTPPPADIANSFPMAGIAGQDVAQLTGTMDIMTILKGIDFGTIILTFILYFLFGYFLYASLYAAIGSAVENEADTQQLIIPVTIPLVVGILLMFHTFQYPDSSISFWGSMIPFTSPMVMMARIPFGVPFWQLALSLALLLVTFAAIAWFAGKIYRVGILMYGKKPSLREMWKWISYKK
jgi:ABC-2 type transport system permease protein